MKSSHSSYRVCFPLLLAVTLLTLAGCRRTVEGRAEDSDLAVNETAEVAAGDWAQWRGPGYDGISRDTDWTAEWPKDGPAVLWKAEIGTGYSSFAVVGDAALTMGHRRGQDTVYCFNIEDGSTRWTFDYPCALVNNLHKGGPGATPAVYQGKVYTLGREGQLHCLDLKTGDKLWQKNIGQIGGADMPEWGFTSSPIIHDGRLLLDAGRVIALNPADGKLLWKSEKLHKPGYGAVRPFVHEQQDLLAVLNCDGLLVVAADDGKRVAFEKWDSPYNTNSTTPMVRGKTIFVSTGYDTGCGLFRLNQDQLELIYANRNMRNHFNNCVLIGDYLYGFDGNSNRGRTVHLVCMEYRTGEVKWKERGLGCGSLMAAGETLIVLGDSGTLVTVKASPEKFEPISRAEGVLPGQCWTVPVLSSGRLYCRDADGNMVCLDVSK